MRKELEEELEYGRNVAEMLVQHLETTGAGKIEIPIENNNGCYHVTVVKTL